MKRPTAIRLSIPEPCHERWADMTPTQRGRYCAACQKEVIDFTGFTPDEIRDYALSHAGQRTCGKLRPDQLTKYLIPAPQFSKVSYALGRGLVAAALATVFLAPTVSAAPPNPYLTERAEAAPDAIPLPAPAGLVPIRGRVLTSDSTALAGVAVSLTTNGSCVGFTTTDDQGCFTLNLRAGAQVAPGATLRFSVRGYRVLELGLSAYQAQRRPEVILVSDLAHTDPDMTLGDVSIEFFAPED